ncbi:hypothetical protein EDC01DRAFT_647906 [Geopyxis carbonaria]|nr:hypothetical protein EDC01DRAFT_647906 [Geopyxis carbonaria]
MSDPTAKFRHRTPSTYRERQSRKAEYAAAKARLFDLIDAMLAALAHFDRSKAALLALVAVITPSPDADAAPRVRDTLDALALAHADYAALKAETTALLGSRIMTRTHGNTVTPDEELRLSEAVDALTPKYADRVEAARMRREGWGSKDIALYLRGVVSALNLGCSQAFLQEGARLLLGTINSAREAAAGRESDETPPAAPVHMKPTSKPTSDETPTAASVRTKLLPEEVERVYAAEREAALKWIDSLPSFDD